MNARSLSSRKAVRGMVSGEDLTNPPKRRKIEKAESTAAARAAVAASKAETYALRSTARCVAAVQAAESVGVARTTKQVSRSGAVQIANDAPRSDRANASKGLSRARVARCVEVLDDEIRHIKSRIEPLRERLEVIRGDVLREIARNRGNEVPSEAIHLEQLTLPELLRIEKGYIGQRLSSRGVLMDDLDANGSPHLSSARRPFATDLPTCDPFPTTSELNMDDIFPSAPKPWTIKIDAPMLARIYRNNAVVAERAAARIKEWADANAPKVLKKEPHTVDSKKRAQMLRVLRRRKLKCAESERKLAKAYVARRRVWLKSLRPMEERRERADERPRPRSNSSSLLHSTVGKRGKDSHASPFKQLDRADVIRSDYEQQKLLERMLETERQRNKLLNSIARIPPFEADPLERKFASFAENKNGLFDPLEEDARESVACVWTDVERLIFLDKFLQYPKKFHYISAFLVNKSTRDCVAYYYASKKAIPYKELLLEQQHRRRGKEAWGTLQRVLRALNIEASASDLSARCLATDFNRAVAYANGASDEEDADSEIDNEVETNGYRSSRETARFVRQLLRVTDNTSSLSSMRHLVEENKRARLEKLNALEKKMTASEKSRTGVRLGARSSSSSSSGRTSRGTTPRKSSNKWQPDEKAKYLECFKAVGKDWESIHRSIPTKTVSQIKNFYQNYKRKLGLGLIAKDLQKSKSA